MINNMKRGVINIKIFVGIKLVHLTKRYNIIESGG